MPLSSDISDFTRRDLTFAAGTKPVFTTGRTGPAIVLMPEIYGFTPDLARFARWIRDAGFRVYVPILLGTPDATNQTRISPTRVAGLCVGREFTMLAAHRSSPVTNWLRQLATLAHQECGGPGVGAIGLCLTGGFALAMAVDPIMLAPVLGEPSLPATAKSALDIAAADLARVKHRTVNEGLTIHGYRFAGDTLCPAARFDTLSREFGAAFVSTTLPDASGNPAGFGAQGKPPHSVFTGDLIDAAGEPTRQAVDDVIAFFVSALQQ